MLELRKEIIRTSRDMFMKFGIRSVSIEDICNEVHISKKTFYTVFKQKDDLVWEVLELISREDCDVPPVDKMDRTRNVVDVAMAFRTPSVRKQNSKYRKFLRDLVKYYPELKNLYNEKHRDEVLRALAAYMELGGEQGMFRQELAQQENIYSLVTVMEMIVSMQEVIAKTEKSEERLLLSEAVADSFLRICCTAAGIEYYQRRYLDGDGQDTSKTKQNKIN